MVASENSETESVRPSNAEEVCAVIQQRLEQHMAKAFPDFNEPINRNMSFDYMGLDSVSRVELITLLSKEFDIKLDPTAAYDFVTIGSLADFVWSEISGTPLDIKQVLDI